LLESFGVDVHFGLVQNEPKTQEEFNSIGLAAGFTVEPVSCRTDFKQKFFSFGLLLSSITVSPEFYPLPTLNAGASFKPVAGISGRRTQSVRSIQPQSD